MENLVNLPALVLDEILGNLKSRELNNLRSTCSTFNSLINRESKYLKRIKIYIHDRNWQLDKILAKSRLDIYNVVFKPKEFGDGRRASKTRQEFMDKFNSTLTQVKFKSNHYSEFMEILAATTNLESLAICAADLCETKLFHQFHEILKIDNFSNLRKLKIKATNDNVHYFLTGFLQKCPHLNYIRLPIWQSILPSADRSPKPIQPLLNFIENRARQLTIDFGGLGFDPNCEELWIPTFKKINRRIFPITPTVLLQICQNSSSRSSKGCVKLRNVQLISLPEKSDLTPAQKSNLDACVESIVMIHADEDHRQKYFPRRAIIQLAIFSPDPDPEFAKFDPKLNLNITSIHWVLDGTIGVEFSPTDLDLDPQIYKKLYERDVKKLIELYVAQGRPILTANSPVNFKLDVRRQFPNLMTVDLFAVDGFCNYDHPYVDWNWKKRKAGQLGLCKAMLKFEF